MADIIGGGNVGLALAFKLVRAATIVMMLFQVSRKTATLAVDNDYTHQSDFSTDVCYGFSILMASTRK
jgi:predicted dinucleotide-binding enzyme